MKILYKKIVILIVMVIIISLLFLGKNSEIKEFYNTFGIELSKNTKVIYSESVFGGLGDGESLVIFEVSPKNMKEIIQKDNIVDWLSLPIPKSTYDKLYEKIGLDSKEIREYLKLDIDEGFYAVIDRSDSNNIKSTIRQNLDYFKFQNFTLAIINIKENKIYLYKYNQ